MSGEESSTGGVGPEDQGRRRFLRIGGGLAASMLMLPMVGTDAIAGMRAGERERALGFYNLHTGERVETVYWAEGRYVHDSLRDINRVLRDHRTNDVARINTELLDLLHRLHQRMGTRQSFHVISGYRSPKTNAMLRRRSRGVAQRSLHMLGMAIDLRLPGRELGTLRRAAADLRAGGVGYYPSSNFIHVDVGRVRYWG